MNTKTASEHKAASSHASNLCRLGFGATGAWGKRWFSERKAIRLIEEAVAAGITHFDTAGFYARGIAETRLGKALQWASADTIRVSSKVGTRVSASGKFIKDFSVAAIRNDVDASLKRLGREHIDIIYLHGPTQEQIDKTRQVFAMLKQEGKIGKVGVCGDQRALSYAASTDAATVLMGHYNAFDQSNGQLFQTAKTRGIETVAIAPLGQALYRRGFLLPSSFADVWYLARAIGKNRAELKHARLIAANALQDIEGYTPTAAMLSFVIANPDIDVIMTNTTRHIHLRESIDTATTPLSDTYVLSKLALLERTRL